MIDSSGSVADSLCAALTLTPLWSAQLAPALNASAGWDVAEVGFDPIEPSGSLTPAVYTVAAALPPACVDVLDRGAKNRTAALAPNALPALVASALQRCYWQSESQTNALRCLYSLPPLAYAFDGDTPQASGAGSADHPAVVAANATLSWLFDLSADSLSQGGWGASLGWPGVQEAGPPLSSTEGHKRERADNRKGFPNAAPQPECVHRPAFPCAHSPRYRALTTTTDPLHAPPPPPGPRQCAPTGV